MIDLNAALPYSNLGHEGTSTDQGVLVDHLNAALPDSNLGQEGTSTDQGVPVDHLNVALPDSNLGQEGTSTDQGVPVDHLNVALPDSNLGQEGTSTDQGVPVDHLNVALPDSNLGQEGTSTDQGVRVDQTSNQVGVPGPSTPIDLEAVDNDVIISSPRTFAEAKSNSRMNRGRPIVVDVEAGDWVAVKNNKRRRTGPNRTFINYDLVINLEGSSSSKSIVPPPTPPPPKDPSFSCPVCMGSLVEETSTKCGHIFWCTSLPLLEFRVFLVLLMAA
ncbi:hypothetical protein Leryth_000827 [Lithospermum erythrorhizon]|nr:hypothetical protein Leryth_000827 [Lithospermum erythrorhizon]